MRQVSGGTMGWVIAGIIAFSGCAGEEGSTALATNNQEKAPALIRAEGRGTTLAPDVVTIETIGLPGDPPAQIPATADKALRAVLEGLHEHRPGALWDALPASYQRDVNDLVHLFARRMHPEAWKWFVQIVKKGAVVLRLARDSREETSEMDAGPTADGAGEDAVDDDDDGTIQQLSGRNRIALSKDENARFHHLLDRERSHISDAQETLADQERREAVAKLFDEIAEAGPVGLETLKTVDVGRLLRHGGSRTLLETWHAATGAAMGTEEMQDIFSLIADPSKVRLFLKETNEETAVVEIIFPNDVPGEIECVRVDGKWIPRLLANAWTPTISNLKRDILESLPSETATENFGPLFQYLAMIDMSFDGDLAQARSNGDENDGRADVQRSALLDAPMLLLDYLIAGPPPPEMDEPMTDADGVLLELPNRLEIDSQEDDTRANASPFERLVGKSLTEEGKQVAVLCHSGAKVSAEHPTFAASIIEEISRRFKAGKISVVEAEKVVAWTKDHAELTADSDLTALATDLGADYIVHFQFESLGFAEENYPELRRGRAQGIVVVAEIAVDEKGQKRTRVVFKQPFESKYPNSPSIVADPEEPDFFKQRYLARLYHELARLFLREP